MYIEKIVKGVNTKIFTRLRKKNMCNEKLKLAFYNRK